MPGQDRETKFLAGSHEGANFVAIIHSILPMVRRRNVELKAYLKDLLTNISAHPHHKLAELLSQKWVNPAARYSLGCVLMMGSPLRYFEMPTLVRF